MPYLMQLAGLAMSRATRSARVHYSMLSSPCQTLAQALYSHCISYQRVLNLYDLEKIPSSLYI